MRLPMQMFPYASLIFKIYEMESRPREHPQHISQPIKGISLRIYSVGVSAFFPTWKSVGMKEVLLLVPFLPLPVKDCGSPASARAPYNMQQSTSGKGQTTQQPGFVIEGHLHSYSYLQHSWTFLLIIAEEWVEWGIRLSSFAFAL